MCYKDKDFNNFLNSKCARKYYIESMLFSSIPSFFLYALTKLDLTVFLLYSRMYQQRVVTGAIIAVLFLLIGIIIYEKLSR